MENLKNQLNELKDKALEEFNKIKDSDILWQLEKKYLGRNGELAKLAKEIKDIAVEQKPVIGQVINEVKGALQEALNEIKEAVGVVAGEAESNSVSFDITLPGQKLKIGRLHPITQIRWQIEDIFRSMGFGIVDGPELESEWYNFEALNIPSWHPARDSQDTFYIKNPKSEALNSKKIKNSNDPSFTKASAGRQNSKQNRLVLRTQTSPVQIRAMEKYGAPLKIIVPGKVFRNEATDARHENTFWQVEGLVIDRDISIAHLKGTMDYVMSRLLSPSHSEPRDTSGQARSESNDDRSVTHWRQRVTKFGMTSREVKTRWRPGYFPFTEPSLEMDIECLLCKSKGCRVCKYTGWLEFMGSGLVHPNVLKSGGINPDEFSGFAFGFGPERLHMLKYGVDDIRYYKNGDLRFLEQF